MKRRLLPWLLLASLCAPAAGVAQDSEEAETEGRVDEDAPRCRGSGSRDRAGGDADADAAVSRRGAGSGDSVGTDPRRGGARDAVSAAPSTPEGIPSDPNERMRDLPTGESPTSITPQAIRLPSGEGTIEGMGELRQRMRFWKRAIE